MTTGHKIKLGKSVKMKDGKLVAVKIYRSASAAIADKKKPKRKYVRRVV